MTSQPREIRSHRQYQSRSAVTRSNAHLWVGVIMFLGIVSAGIMLDRAGREPEAVIASLSAWTAIGLGVVTALAKLTTVEQAGAVVEQRTNGQMREMVREEVRAAISEVIPRQQLGEGQR